MRNFIIGIATGIATTLVIGAASNGPRYQIAAAARADGPPYIFRMDTHTGAIEACRYASDRIPTGTPIQIIPPR
jgi:flavoprotein